MKLRQLVLLAEPSASVASEVEQALRGKGFDVSTVTAGGHARTAAEALSADVIVANEELPDMSGAELRRALASGATSDLLVILYRPHQTGRTRQGYAIEPGLYASEPVTLSRFCQRIAALSRPRHGRSVPPLLVAGSLRVDTIAHRVLVDGREVDLTALEFRLLVTFMSSSDLVLTRPKLLREVWGIRAHDATRTIDTNVKRLRHKLGSAAECIETLRNIGYRFSATHDGGPAAYPTRSAGESSWEGERADRGSDAERTRSEPSG